MGAVRERGATCSRAVFHDAAGDVAQLEDLAGLRGDVVDGYAWHFHGCEGLARFVVHGGGWVVGLFGDVLRMG